MSAVGPSVERYMLFTGTHSVTLTLSCIHSASESASCQRNLFVIKFSLLLGPFWTPPLALACSQATPRPPPSAECEMRPALRSLRTGETLLSLCFLPCFQPYFHLSTPVVPPPRASCLSCFPWTGRWVVRDTACAAVLRGRPKAQVLRGSLSKIHSGARRSRPY